MRPATAQLPAAGNHPAFDLDALVLSNRLQQLARARKQPGIVEHLGADDERERDLLIGIGGAVRVDAPCLVPPDSHKPAVEPVGRV